MYVYWHRGPAFWAAHVPTCWKSWSCNLWDSLRILDGPSAMPPSTSMHLLPQRPNSLESAVCIRPLSLCAEALGALSACMMPSSSETNSSTLDSVFMIWPSPSTDLAASVRHPRLQWYGRKESWLRKVPSHELQEAHNRQLSVAC